MSNITSIAMRLDNGGRLVLQPREDEDYMEIQNLRNIPILTISYDEAHKLRDMLNIVIKP